MNGPGESSGPLSSLEQQFDELFASTSGLRFAKSRDEEEGSVDYKVITSPASGLSLSFNLLSNVLFVSFNACFLMAEQVAHERSFGTNPNAFEDWCKHCMELVRDILESPQLMIVRHRYGPGGRLYRREGDKWICCGGEMFVFFGKKEIYSHWR